MSMRLSYILARSSSSWLFLASGRTNKGFFNPAVVVLLLSGSASRRLAIMPDTRGGTRRRRPPSTRRGSASSSSEASGTASSPSSPAQERPKRKRKTKDGSKTELVESDPLIASDNTTTGDPPWHHIFTKGDEQYDHYMSTEWGFELRGDVPLFEKLSLEGAQSGLSWLTVLRKREAYRRVFHDFDIDQVAAMTEKDVQAILDEASEDTTTIVVRHRGKLESVINNAKCIQTMRKGDLGDGAFDRYLWSFVDNKPILNAWNGNLSDGYSKTEESIAMSKALKKLGFRFVGPTTCYAMMQSAGMVIDHPRHSPEWERARTYLQERAEGYQDRTK